MPEVVQAGEGNLGSNASGVGAVMFDRTEDPLAVHLANLKGIDEAAAQRQKIQQQKLALVTKMAGALNPKMDGIFPGDRQFLTDQQAQVNQAFLNYMKSGADPTNPSSGQAFTDFHNRQAQVEGWIESSKGTNKKMVQYTAQMDADAKGKQELDYDAGSKAMAGIMSLPLPQREQVTNWDQRVIVPATPPLDKMMGDFVKKTYSKQDKTSSNVQTTPQGFMYQTTKAENFTPAQAREVAQNIPTNPQWQAALNQSWKAVPPDKQQAYLSKYTSDATVNPTQAEDKAKVDYAYDKMMLMYHQESAGYKYLGVTPDAKEQAKVNGKNAQLAAKYAWFPGMVSDIFNGNPQVMSNQVFQRPGAAPATVFGTTRLNALQLGTYKKVVKLDDGQGNMRDQEVSFPNNVLIAHNVDGKAYIATSESVANANPAVPGSEFVSFSDPGEMMTYLGQRMADKQALSGGFLAVDAKKARTSGSGFSATKYAPMTTAQKTAQPAAQAAPMVNQKLPVSQVPGAPAAEKRYVIGDKHYSVSALQKAGYSDADIAKLKEYRAN